MIRRKNKKEKKKLRKEGFIVTRHQMGFPGDIKSIPKYNRVLRYRVATAFTDKSLTMGSLVAHQVFCISAASAQAYTIVDALKLTRVVLYYTPSDNLGGLGNEISFKWINLGNFGDTMTDTGTVSEPAKITALPIEDSLTDRAFRMNDAEIATNIMTINAPVGAIIDFHVTFTLLDGAGTSITLSANGPYIGVAPVSISLGTLIPQGTVNSVTTTSI